jgi:hypothetical protein
MSVPKHWLLKPSGTNRVTTEVSTVLWHFGLLAPKSLKIVSFPTIRLWAYLTKVILSVPDEGYFECTWWRLFWAYLTKVILSVPDEGYFERTWWRLFWAYLMKVILSVPDEGYFECQVRSKQPSSGTLKITVIRYAQNNLHQVRSK